MNNNENKKYKINIEIENRLRYNLEKYNILLKKYEKENNLYSIKENTINEQLDYCIEINDYIIFKNISNKSILSKSENIITGAIINYNKFSECKFKDLVFVNCSFYGTIFSDCTFENVVFEKCSFFDLSGFITLFKDNCSISECVFKNCNLEKSIFINTSLYKAKFILSNLKYSILKETNIKSMIISDCDMRNIKIIDSKMEDLLFEDEFLTKLDEESFIDEMVIDKGNKDLEKVYKIYKDLSTKFEANRLPNKAGEYYYLYKMLENKNLKGLDKIKSYIYWMLCGYGEKPTYALITSIEIVLIFTLLYMFTGLSIGTEIIDYDILILKELPSSGLLLDFLKSLYFSVVTFTTVGYGDITPIGYSVLLSGIEMFLGVTMVGIWTATLARKITR